MTISSDQIVLAESEVMADTDDGGGRMSGRIVVSGQVNNTFPDISRVDRVYGRVNLRKLYLYINAANQDTLLGAHTILSERPTDPNVHALLFTTGSHTDRRTEAQDRIESYVVASTESSFWLWGKQLAGQRAVQALAFPSNQRDPEPGQIFVLKDLAAGAEQYVRVTGVEIDQQTFTIDRGNSFYQFRLKTYAIELAQPLREDFQGSDPHPTGNRISSTKILKTQVADAAKYMGASPLAEPAAVGDRTIKVASAFAPLVPSAQSENAITDQAAGALAAIIRPASTQAITLANIRNVTVDANGAGVYYTGRAIVPGSLTISGDNGSYKDEGGRLVHTGGSNNLDEELSVVDYQNGEVRAAYTGGTTARNTTITFTPGAAISQQTKQAALEVNQQTRSLTWVHQTDPVAAIATLTVEYRAQGNWYLLQDKGAGELEGDGTGTLDYATGTTSFTLAALPDSGTAIIIAWGEKQGTIIEAGTSAPQSPTVRIEVGENYTG
ncbi:hypothetical protein MIH18_23810 (plasmid) [Marinobacter sp. M3C]|jgi:Tfp pilus assembly protein FimT|uniref:hypothetical protein n=1 Tax=Marinobacter sp. M3C TaxID=2917715 RepID=UPI00200DB611|nr:hypothetical protein [Marinobacter sp. M3C]MCL1485188.1 hypothetical protein [Marinobacter sp.]UQG62788.1 hypothetical protein MIH18_23810 [Marinobacter sp. M3C]